jgi:D-alanyl-D-alanine endopeptidase (penicillin-binding protein 7)
LAVLIPLAVAGPLARPTAATAATARKAAARKAHPASGQVARHRSSTRVAASRTLRRRPARRSHLRRHRTYVRYGSRAAVVIDARTGEVLFEKNAASQLPVASLSKLMTDIVFLETDPDLDRQVTIEREDLLGSGKTQLRSGEIVTVHQLLYHSLMSSDNAATRALVRTSGVPRDEFLARMNRKASVLGLHSTQFVEFTGLDPGNVSSASDIAQLLKYASSQPLVAEITSQPEYEYRSSRRVHHLVNSNRLARYGQVDVRSGKTGFIQSAGYCVATWVREGSRDLITVVLGAPTKQARFNETRRLLQQVGLSSPATGSPTSLPAGISGAVPRSN